MIWAKQDDLILAVLVATGISFPLAAQAEEEQPVVLSDITVKGEAITGEPTTVNTITAEDLSNLNLQRTEQLLELVPGIEIHNYSQGGVANEFEMRGYGNAGHGGDAAIAIDGIPLNEGQSHADGYADMNVIIPLEIEFVDVFMGPSSPLFGNFARGGAISFNTRKTGEYNIVQIDGGSFDTYDAQYAFGRSLTDTIRNNTALQLFTTDGYQDNSSWQRQNFSSRFGWKAAENLDLALAVRLNKAVWDAPGYIPEAQFYDEEASMHQAVNAENDGGNKLFTTQKLEAGYNLNKESRILAWTYATEQDFTRWAKFGYDPGGQTEKHHERFVSGAGTSYNYEGTVAGKGLNGVAGVEYFQEDTETDIYATTYRVRTAQTENRTFIIDTVSLFGQADYSLHPLCKPWVGARYDSFGGEYRNNDPGSEPFSRDMNDYSHLSPKIGMHSQLLQSLDFRTSFTQGFALPADADKYNSALDDTTEVINQYEAGLNFTPAGMVTADLAVFRIDNSNEIQETFAGSGVFVSVGETRRQGLEFSTVVKPWLAGLELFGNATITDTEIIDNVDKTLIGKQVTGVPDYSTKLGVRYRSRSGIDSQITWRHVDRYFIDSANLTTYQGYDVTDFGLCYTAKIKNSTKYRIGFNLDNLFDEHYSQAVFNSFGTNNYAVSAPRTYWLRLTLYL